MKYLISFGLFLLLIHVASAQIIVVPDDYQKIQWAIDNASVDDMIVVKDGIYIENVVIDKSITLMSESGPNNCKIGAADSDLPVIKIVADNAKVTGFCIEGQNCGIYIYDSDICVVHDMKFVSNKYSVRIKNSDDCEVYDCVFDSNEYGIILNSSEECLIMDNNFIGNDFAVVLNTSDDNEISENYFESNTYGIFCENSNSNYIESNEFVKDEKAVVLKSSNELMIDDNSFTDCVCSLSLMDSFDNEIYLNDFVRSSVKSQNSVNYWNSTILYLYEYNGHEYVSYIGNYWDDYTGVDSNNDGIGEQSYIIDTDNLDYYPLISSKDYYALKFEVIATPTPVFIPEFPVTVLPLAICIMLLIARRLF